MNEQIERKAIVVKAENINDIVNLMEKTFPRHLYQ